MAIKFGWSTLEATLHWSRTQSRCQSRFKCPLDLEHVVHCAMMTFVGLCVVVWPDAFGFSFGFGSGQQVRRQPSLNQLRPSPIGRDGTQKLKPSFKLNVAVRAILSFFLL
ncbi:hypothetical protein ACLKA6_004242 [Drosophila palustris]